MLTNRPTVALTSATAIGRAANSPTRASDPRTEMMRPNDATAAGAGGLCIGVMRSIRPTMCEVVAETVKPTDIRVD
jgi:hypothetical protein